MPKILDDIPPEYLHAIGEVVAYWNFFEQQINLAVAQLLSHDRHNLNAHIALAHMSFPQKLDVLCTVCEQDGSSDAYPFLGKYKVELQPLLKDAQSKRNAVIHAVWGMKESKVMKGSLTARGTLKLSIEEASLEDIRKVRLTIEEARMSLLEMIPRRSKKRVQRRKRGKS